ncbi:MAG: ATPase, T2SS/T4P/T4SS family [Longicatena sp.]
MKEKFNQLLHLAKKNNVTDIHFTLTQQKVSVMMRGIDGLEEIHNTLFDVSLFNYLKYISDLDLGNSNAPQSGNFHYEFQKELLYFRFSLLVTNDKQTAVLRILNNHEEIRLEDLSYQKKQYHSFLGWTKTRSGLIVLSGPTGSGKSTTLHAILKRIALENKLHVVSLEDPIEIYDNAYLQLQINEKSNFTYEEGIKQLMRHDPDVIMIGEIRDANTARMLLRSALSGHLIFTTIHAKCCTEAIKRLLEFGLSEDDLYHTLTAISSQRLFVEKGKKGRICIYEILEKEDLQQYFANKELPKNHEDIFAQIQHAVEDNKITKKEASYDLAP